MFKSMFNLVNSVGDLIGECVDTASSGINHLFKNIKEYREEELDDDVQKEQQEK